MIIYGSDKKRQFKRVQLIKKLFWILLAQAIKNHNIKNDLYNRVKIKIKKFGTGSRHHIDIYQGIILHTVTVDLFNSEILKENGLNLPNYYEDRPRIINKYIYHNRHNKLRFTLLHEIKHIIDNDKEGTKYHYNSTELNREYRADCYALKYLKHSTLAEWNT